MPVKHLLIKGKVQGVFFRATAKDIADGLGLTGWIRNTAEGNVEAVARGSVEQLQSFVDWCRKGPRSANVITVTVNDIDEEDFTGFKIIRG